MIHWLRRRFADRFLLVLLVVQLTVLLLLFLGSPTGFSADEGELHQSTAGWLIASGYLGLLPALQYTPFCGGCTVEGVLYAPLSAVLGPKLWAWKLIPWGFCIAVLVFGYKAARQLAGFRAARVFGLWMILAPDWYRFGTMQGFGSHMEVMAFVLGGLLLWCRAIHEPGRIWSLCLGLVWGLGFWFCYTSAFAPPVLLAVWFLRVRTTFVLRRLAAIGLGTAVGLVPWLAIGSARRGMGLTGDGPGISVYGEGPTTLIGLEHIPRRLMDLFGSAWWESMYALGLGENGVIAGVASSLVLLAAIAGAIAWARITRATRERGPLALAVVALLGAFTLAYVLVEPGGAGDPTRLGIPRSPNAMRYLLPLIPLLGLCIAGAWEAALHQGGRFLWGRALAAGILLLAGGTSLAATLTDRIPSTRPLYLHALDLSGVAERLPVNPSIGHDFEIALGRPAGTGWLRHMQLHAVGASAAPGFIRKPNGQLGPWVAAQNLTDRQALLGGLAEGIRRLGVVHLEADRFPGLRVADSAAELSVEDRCTLYRNLIRTDPGPAMDALRAQAPSQPVRALTHASPCARSAIAWAWGRAAAEESWWGHSRTLHDPLDRLVDTLPTTLHIPDADRPATMAGLGHRFGELWGFSEDHARAIVGSIAPQDQTAFRLGFERGAREVFGTPAPEASP